MKRKINVLIACGSGVATSTVAMDIIKDIAVEENLKLQLFKGTLAEIPMKERDVDAVLTTTRYCKALVKPHMSIFGLISGVNEALVREKLIAFLKDIAED